MKKSLLVIFAVMAVCLAQENLLNNGGFDEKSVYAEMIADFTPQTFELKQFIEDGTWNKCLRVELKKLTIMKDGSKRLGLFMHFGRTGKLPGFKAKPNTFYQFSFDIMGDVPSASTKAVSWNGDEPGIWAKSRKTITTSLGSFPVNSEWTRLEGTFRTGPDAERVAFGIQLWSDSAQVSNFKWKEGQYILLDNLVVKEKLNMVGGAVKAPQASEDWRRYECLPFKMDSFISATDGKPSSLKCSAEMKIEGDAIRLVVECEADTPIKANVKENKDIWRDDVVEVFFGPTAAADRTLSQFVLAAGGGRYCGRGGISVAALDAWKAVPTVNGNSWKADFTIPFTELGYAGKPAAGESILFNVSLQHEKTLATWSPVRGNFHDTARYNMIIFGTPADYAAKCIAALKDCPAEFVERRQALGKEAKNAAEIHAQFVALEEDIKNERFGKATYLVGTLPVTSDYELPLELDVKNIIFDGNKPIELRGAINEVVSLPITITNRTDEAEAYRVILHQNCSPAEWEAFGLADGFPKANVEMLEAIAQKDSDKPGAKRRYDALPKMNQAFIITVPARQTGMVWINFDCTGVEPKKYTGMVRVSPLGEKASIVSRKYSGTMKDYKVSLEVLPIELDFKNPENPTWLMERGTTEALFAKEVALGGRYIMVSPWSFNFKFDEQGNVLDSNLPKVTEWLKSQAERYEKHGCRNGVLFLVSFSGYTVFEKNFMPKKMQVMSPEWRNCWANNLKAMREVFQRAGVKDSEWGIEVFDEPPVKNIERDLEVAKIARETLPGVLLEITWAAPNFGQTPETIRKFDPFIDIHCFWASHCNSPDYRKLMKELRDGGKEYWIYYCSTSMRESLYRYYRLHAWRTVECGAKVIGLYYFVDAPYGSVGAVNWKTAAAGGLMYRSDNDCVSTVRHQAFRMGVTDIAYLGQLKRLAAKGDSALHKEARAFLESAPKTAMREAHDSKCAERLREKSIELILELKNAK